MRVVWTAELPAGTPTVDFELPHGAVFLDAQMIGDKAYVFYEVDPRLPPEKRTAYLIPNGAALPSEGRRVLAYRATLALPGGKLVFHLYEDIGKLSAKRGGKTPPGKSKK